MPSMKHFLDQTEQKRLVEQHTYEKEGRIRDRIKAVLPYDKGWSYQKEKHDSLAMKPSVNIL